MKRKLLGLVPFIFIISFLSGCSSRAPITPESTGFWNHYFVFPISYIIQFIAHVMGDDYGLSIIVITILIRLVLSPIVISLNDNQLKMQQLQPEMKRLRETYASKDAETQKKLNQEMMKLYQEHKINPAMGCLPVIAQMFILMALYNAIVRTKAISTHTFLWFDLGTADPLHILPLLAALATFVQYFVMYKRSQQNPTPQSQQMKMMLYFMPIMIFMMSFKLAAAIGLYWVAGNTFMALQSIYLDKRKQKKQAMMLEITK
ncbi:membrane protein insertase YidC [Bacillus sp. 165]|uniref:membrane protein insertase YidC n=1 Tax=Bacillus sp. 165 TaxID=1529117 RepID=UPI001AD9CC08|nr:membrane protein insertase YidC [Bacillus sp. 165]MBO9129308.1 membrane protein insertase YidC [Bacillus sp. 165]